jgi:hypothetical protein
MVGGGAVQDVKNTDKKHKWELCRIAAIVEE